MNVFGNTLFESLGGVPRHLLYDRMKTAVAGTDGDTGEVIFNRSLLSCLHHYGAWPRACQPYRPQTKGKIERIFGYVKKDFILGSSFDSLSHLNVLINGAVRWPMCAVTAPPGGL